MPPENDPAPTSTPATSPDETPSNTPAPGTEPATTPEDTANLDEDTAKTPEQLLRERNEARKDAYKYRTERNADRERMGTLENQLSGIAKALGLESDTPDPDELQKQLTQKDQELRTLRVESAFTKSAAKADADAELTLAVLDRQGALRDLDPSADDFQSQLDRLVKAAVEANPKLKATPMVPTKSGSRGMNGDSGGRPTGHVPLGDAVLKAMT